MRLDARQLNRATLQRQLLLRREPLDAVAAVHRVVALQAQGPASPYLALWTRMEGFDPAEFGRAFVDLAVVKATLMRITLHAVVRADYPEFHVAMQPSLRAARLNDRRFTSTGLTAADADGLIEPLLDFTDQPRSNADVEACLRPGRADRSPSGPGGPSGHMGRSATPPSAGRGRSDPDRPTWPPPLDPDRATRRPIASPAFEARQHHRRAAGQADGPRQAIGASASGRA
jgi:hypothetical protein